MPEYVTYRCPECGEEAVTITPEKDHQHSDIRQEIQQCYICQCWLCHERTGPFGSKAAAAADIIERLK